MASVDVITSTADTTPAPLVGRPPRSRLRYWLGNWKFSLGVALILALVLFSLIGSFFVTYSQIEVASGPLKAEPSAQYPLGTDNVGRNVMALMVYGIPPSLKLGLIAGVVATVVGTVLGLISGYYRGPSDSVIRILADIMLTIPSLMLLVVIASYFRTTTIELTALIVAIFAWAGPARAIRAQTLSMRERAFVRVAKLSGRSDLEIILLEIMPNLLPYIAAGLVGAVAGGILASVGIQLLGLGPLFTPNLGMILQFAFNGAALYQGMWWWWGPPVVALLVLFIGLFLISLALDEYGNPRLREQAG
jgi:peptide/nickel transport system permease protein